MSQPYKTAPVPSKKMPSGIPYIVGNEGAERYSFYAMKGILVVFMTQYMLNSQGDTDYMTEDKAMFYYHLFTSAVYFTPLIGALLADYLWGKYPTIILLSIVYCLGHFVLAIDDTRFGLAVGLSLIAIGAGGIKPCVSAHVGDQFGKTNQHLLPKIFAWFYFSINLGSFFATIIGPWMLNNPKYGPKWAFGVPGVLMAIATLFFWLGRHKFVHIPPGRKKFLKETFSPKGLKAIGNLSVLVLFIAVFWSVFDQTGSKWVLQGQMLDLRFGSVEILPAQMQSANPLLILAFIPLFTYLIYPLMNKVIELTLLRKISIGFFVAVVAFGSTGWIEMNIHHGGEFKPLEGALTCTFTEKGGTEQGKLEAKLIDHVLIGQMTIDGQTSVQTFKAYPKNTIKKIKDEAKNKATSTAPPAPPQTDIEDKTPTTQENGTDIKKENKPDRLASGQWLIFFVDNAQAKANIQSDPNAELRLGVNDKQQFTGAVNVAGGSYYLIGDMPHIAWQFLAYILLTAAEILVSITALEFFYSQAPKTMKSIIMAIFLSSVAIGNMITSLVNLAIQNPDHTSKLPGASYYWFFTGFMLVTAVLFLIFMKFYKGQTYIHEETSDVPVEETIDEAIGNV